MKNWKDGSISKRREDKFKGKDNFDFVLVEFQLSKEIQMKMASK